MEKDFPGWQTLKEQLHAQHNLPTFEEREVWWCSIGHNIGFEEDGKNRLYNRPVLVMRKFNRQLFLGVPLTTQVKERWYYHRLTFKGREQCAILTQVRSWSSRRLTHQLGKLPGDDFEKVREAVKALM